MDCDLTSPAANGECGASSNALFGQQIPTLTYDPETYTGWGSRGYNWEFGGSVQHELYPGIALEVGYNRRHWGNFTVTYNELVGASDYDQWNVPVPSHPDLPDIGSTATFVAITPAAAARGSQEFQTKEANVAGETRTAYWHGVDVNGTARLSGNLNVTAGTSTGPSCRR